LERLEFCVYLGAIDDDRPREHAEAMFVAAGLHERPAIVIVVAPKQRRIEIVTGPSARDRITDADATRVVTLMSASLASGDLTRGLVAALDQLTAIAGAGVAADGIDLPNLVDG
jgi:uncharacterized membrane protein YgcG